MIDSKKERNNGGRVHECLMQIAVSHVCVKTAPIRASGYF